MKTDRKRHLVLGNGIFEIRIPIPKPDMNKYKLIPFTDVTPEARDIAVAWIENYQPMGFDIEQKHKLASDIMNYANQQLAEYKEKLKKRIELYIPGVIGYTDGEIIKLIDNL